MTKSRAECHRVKEVTNGIVWRNGLGVKAMSGLTIHEEVKIRVQEKVQNELPRMLRLMEPYQEDVLLLQLRNFPFNSVFNFLQAWKSASFQPREYGVFSNEDLELATTRRLKDYRDLISISRLQTTTNLFRIWSPAAWITVYYFDIYRGNFLRHYHSPPESLISYSSS
ncbi:hypothetical protein HKBW3S47_01393 [Candidatus Hakubella thermalkaliphila]|uniref:Uncharacterized protein n=1 Tax=Candidatus Hakubella thermalkaliphila TaxID=2754717 RepID=A0A6V8Q4K8_9ACTN|nr:hypothetical protein HKBW3S47_01393 [Candidatus Hakubella thermalkaliphila]GFP43566.1 hypothetical protein HKBW3C_02696 [Candidatus Hakubella thermalkaliphila]